MKKQIVVTPETTEEKLQRVYRQKEEADRNLQLLAAMLSRGMGFYCINLDYAAADTPWLTILGIATGAIFALVGLIGFIIIAAGSTYQCQECGHTHVHADPFQILAFHLFGKKSLVCPNCNCKQPHRKLPRTRREK